MNGAGRIPMLPRKCLCSMGDTPRPAPPLPPLTPLHARRLAFRSHTRPANNQEGEQKMTKQTMKWNGLTLEISAEPNRVLSRLNGEEITSLKVTSPATAKPLINDAFAASLIAQAG